MNYVWWIILILAVIVISILFYYGNITEGLENNIDTSMISRIDNMLRMINIKLNTIKSSNTSTESDSKSIERFEKQQGFLIDTREVLFNKADINKYNADITKLETELANITNESDKTNKQTEINELINIRTDIELNKDALEEKNKDRIENDTDNIYSKLMLLIDGKSSSRGSDPAVTYEIPDDPDDFYDYINEEEILKDVKEDSTAWVMDKDGNMVELNMDEIKDTADKLSDNVNYYEPGTYKYDSSYVPTYEDGIYLSKTTGKSTVSEVVDEKSFKGGICSHYKDQPEKLEEQCNKLDKNLCGAIDCCVLLGGSKCVSGNAQGPVSKLHYGDITIRNRDYYYYKGKCYGNCESKFIPPENKLLEKSESVVSTVKVNAIPNKTLETKSSFKPVTKKDMASNIGPNKPTV